MLAGAKFSKAGASIKVSDWLPYNLEEQSTEALALSSELLVEIGQLSLPPAMMRDLIKHKLITPKN